MAATLASAQPATRALAAAMSPQQCVQPAAHTTRQMMGTQQAALGIMPERHRRRHERLHRSCSCRLPRWGGSWGEGDSHPPGSCSTIPGPARSLRPTQSPVAYHANSRNAWSVPYLTSMRPSWSVSNPSSDGRARAFLRADDTISPSHHKPNATRVLRHPLESEARRRLTSVRDLAWCLLIGPRARRSRPNPTSLAKKRPVPRQSPRDRSSFVVGHRRRNLQDLRIADSKNSGDACLRDLKCAIHNLQSRIRNLEASKRGVIDRHWSKPSRPAHP